MAPREEVWDVYRRSLQSVLQAERIQHKHRIAEVELRDEALVLDSGGGFTCGMPYQRRLYSQSKRYMLTGEREIISPLLLPTVQLGFKGLDYQ